MPLSYLKDSIVRTVLGYLRNISLSITYRNRFTMCNAYKSGFKSPIMNYQANKVVFFSAESYI